jgi:molybdopterin/thiamine biosynthesis adenylyltransferase
MILFRLRGSKVLLVGCTGLSAEIAKNIVLAGIGALTLIDGYTRGFITCLPEEIDDNNTVRV